MPNRAMLPAGTTASRKRVAVWESDIREAARVAMGERPPFAGAVRLMVEFALAPPKTTIRKHEWGWLPHTKRPDWDKLSRMLGDALTGIVWRDDSQVCMSAINKVYAWDGRSGAHVEVSEIDEESAKRFARVAASLREAIERRADPMGLIG